MRISNSWNFVEYGDGVGMTIDLYASTGKGKT